MVYIETGKGRSCRGSPWMTRSTADYCDFFGWWFPEERGTVFGWDKSNINVLTRSEPPYDPGIGTSDLRGYLQSLQEVIASL